MVERRDMFEAKRARWKGSGEDISCGAVRERERGGETRLAYKAATAYQLST